MIATKILNISICFPVAESSSVSAAVLGPGYRWSAILSAIMPCCCNGEMIFDVRLPGGGMQPEHDLQWQRYGISQLQHQGKYTPLVVQAMRGDPLFFFCCLS